MTLHSSQNYLLVASFSHSSQYQDEIRSTHWHYNQVSVFTLLVWIDNMNHSYEKVLVS